jgi:competence ComEA-like helix-hairpin-helix protein
VVPSLVVSTADREPVESSAFTSSGIQPRMDEFESGPSGTDDLAGPDLSERHEDPSEHDSSQNDPSQSDASQSDEAAPVSTRTRSRKARAQDAEPIDINTADWQLIRQALPGVGEVLAKRIVAHRDEHGPFGDLDDLARVPGVSPRLTMRIAPKLSIAASYVRSRSVPPEVRTEEERARFDEAAAAYERISEPDGAFATSGLLERSLKAGLPTTLSIADVSSSQAELEFYDRTTVPRVSSAPVSLSEVEFVERISPVSDSLMPSAMTRVESDDWAPDSSAQSFVHASSLVPNEPSPASTLGTPQRLDVPSYRVSSLMGAPNPDGSDDLPPLDPPDEVFVGGALFEPSSRPIEDEDLRASREGDAPAQSSSRRSLLEETPAPPDVRASVVRASEPPPVDKSSPKPTPKPVVVAPAKAASPQPSRPWLQAAGFAALALVAGLGGAWFGAAKAPTAAVERVSTDMADVKTNVDAVRTDVDTLKDRVSALSSAHVRTETRLTEQEALNLVVDDRISKQERDAKELSRLSQSAEEKAKRAEERSETSAARLQKVEEEMTWHRMVTDSKVDSLRQRVRQAADDLESVAPRKRTKVSSAEPEP